MYPMCTSHFSTIWNTKAFVSSQKVQLCHCKNLWRSQNELWAIPVSMSDQASLSWTAFLQVQLRASFRKSHQLKTCPGFFFTGVSPTTPALCACVSQLLSSWPQAGISVFHITRVFHSCHHPKEVGTVLQSFTRRSRSCHRAGITALCGAIFSRAFK